MTRIARTVVAFLPKCEQAAILAPQQGRYPDGAAAKLLSTEDCGSPGRGEAGKSRTDSVRVGVCR